jgi:hypothetical protein
VRTERDAAKSQRCQVAEGPSAVRMAASELAFSHLTRRDGCDGSRLVLRQRTRSVVPICTPAGRPDITWLRGPRKWQHFYLYRWFRFFLCGSIVRHARVTYQRIERARTLSLLAALNAIRKLPGVQARMMSCY